jgi:PAS domain S-box-containing protein
MSSQDLQKQNQHLKDYIREKVNELLSVVGTAQLKPEELTDEMLLELDPIGIVSKTFEQILENTRETNRELKIAKDEIEAIFNAAGVGIMVIDKELNILAFNREQAKLFDYDLSTIHDRKCYQANCKREKMTFACGVKNVFRGEKMWVERWECRGHVFNIVGEPIRDHDGEIIQAVICYLDITDRVTAEEEMAREKDQLAVTLQAINEGVMSLDENCTVVLANDMATKILGIRRDSLVGHTIRDILFSEEEKAYMKTCHYTDTERRLYPYQGSMCKQVYIDGSRRIVEIYQMPVYTAMNRLTAVVLILKDITERLHMENELLRRQKLESLSILTGGIAHDFNNILTAAMSNVAMAHIQMEKNGLSSEYLVNAEQALQQARDLVRQLSTFAKGGSPVKETTSLKELLEKIIQFTLSGARVSRTITIADDLDLVDIDTTQFGQVLNNLLLNAIQAMPEGGNLTLDARNREITEKDTLTLSPGRYVQVSITDTGVGIPEEYQKQIFDPFFTTKKEGSGIGLATAYSIIKRHNGYISVESEENRGTTFSVFIPSSSGTLTMKEEVPVRPSPEAHRGRILVMDDDERILKSTGTLLRTLGYEVDTASSGEEALEKSRHMFETGERYDCVLMDLVVPEGMGGLDTITPMKEIDPEVYIIVSSGYSQEEVLSNYRDHGFDGVIPKPYKIEELSSELHRLLG